MSTKEGRNNYHSNSSGVVGTVNERDRTATNVQLLLNLESASRDSLQLLGTKLGNDCAPLAYSSGADSQRPRNIRGRLKVIEGGLLEHEPHLTTVHSHAQPRSKTVMLTLVQMDKLPTLADRLKDAMADRVSASELARACNISPTAVHKWLAGTTKRLSADNYQAAASKLHIREQWLRTGKGPREGQHSAEDREAEQVFELLEEITEPLVQLANALQKLRALRSTTGKKA